MRLRSDLRLDLSHPPFTLLAGSLERSVEAALSPSAPCSLIYRQSDRIATLTRRVSGRARRSGRGAGHLPRARRTRHGADVVCDCATRCGLSVFVRLLRESAALAYGPLGATQRARPAFTVGRG